MKGITMNLVLYKLLQIFSLGSNIANDNARNKDDHGVKGT